MRNLIARLTTRQFIAASLVTLATLIVLNGLLVTAARQVSTQLTYLVPLLAALISYVVGIAAINHINNSE